MMGRYQFQFLLPQIWENRNRKVLNVSGRELILSHMRPRMIINIRSVVFIASSLTTKFKHSFVVVRYPNTSYAPPPLQSDD